jgi:MFS family permease
LAWPDRFRKRRSCSLPFLLAAVVGYWVLVLAGAFDMISGLFRSTIWNTTIPDNLRGRMAGIEMISYTSGPLLGQVESGVVASFAGVRASFVSGGLLCVAGCAAAAFVLPALWAYEKPGRSP